MRGRTAGGDVVAQGHTTCCYAGSEKSWIDDPSGIAWEAFHTTGESTDDGDGTGERIARVAREKEGNAQPACCAPATATAGVTQASCCATGVAGASQDG